MDKKKKALEHEAVIQTESKFKNDTPAMVTEIVEDDNQFSGESEIVNSKLPKEVEKKSSEIIEDRSPDVPNIQEPVEEPIEKSKEVVQELFSKPNSGDVTEISIQPEKSSKTFFWWAVVVIVAAITTGACLVFVSRNKPNIAILQAKPTPTQLPIPTITPAPVLNKSDILIKVLNGGGIAGAGTKMKNYLIEKGYQVTVVGNADEYTYDKTQISTKVAKQGILDVLKLDLADKYTVDSTDTSVATSAAYDALVIVGKE